MTIFTNRTEHQIGRLVQLRQEIEAEQFTLSTEQAALLYDVANALDFPVEIVVGSENLPLVESHTTIKRLLRGNNK